MYPEAQQGGEAPAGKSRIRRALDLISTLISASHSIRPFAVKWQLIRNKLEELLSSLSAVENCDDYSGENSQLFAAVNAISGTLESCLDLASRCADLSYGGKLQTQSDLDIVSAKLDGHIKNLAEIYARGLLSQGYAIVVSKPGLSASRDDMKFYISDLLSRLKIGCKEMKKQALIAFNEVIQEDDRYVKVAIEIDNFVGVLVNFLDFHEDDIIQEEASKAVSVIAGFQAYRGVLIRIGIIGPLIRALESGSDLSKEYATRCLQKVTENSDNAWSVSAQGGVTVLLKMCSNSDCRGELVALACGVLRNLVGVEEIKRFMVEEGAIPSFIKLVRLKDEVTQICAIEFLQCVASGDESTRQMVIREGGVGALVNVLDPKSLFSSKTREVALRGIMNLCSSSASFVTVLLSYGFVDHVLYFLRYGEGSIQEVALKAAFWLCGTSEESKKAIGDAGVMPELVRFLDSESYEVREMAAETLSSLVVVPGNRKRFVQNDQNVVLLLQMLDPQEARFGNKKLLLSILLPLTSCNTARKKIVNSGYLNHIEKLAEADVSDAKKIVRKLSTSRFKNILSGIWHS
nr:vacuolar protein 8 [Ipomoea batatas]